MTQQLRCAAPYHQPSGRPLLRPSPPQIAAWCPSTVTVTLHIENHYEFYATVVTTPTITIPCPPDQADEQAYDDWAYAHIFSATGTGRCDGDSWYFVTITASTAPGLIGRTFEFGL